MRRERVEASQNWVMLNANFGCSSWEILSGNGLAFRLQLRPVPLFLVCILLCAAKVPQYAVVLQAVYGGNDLFRPPGPTQRGPGVAVIGLIIGLYRLGGRSMRRRQRKTAISRWSGGGRSMRGKGGRSMRGKLG